MRRLNNSIFQGDPPKLDMSQFWNKPVDYPFQEEEQPSPPANRTQLAIDRGYLPEREEGLSNQEYMDALAENPKEKKPFDFFNFGLGMRRASAGASWLSGIKERNRQNQYLQNQLSTLGQLDALPAEQPNPYNLYAKYGGKLSKFANGGQEDPKKKKQQEPPKKQEPSKREPIVVNDKNDPRLRAYSDSQYVRTKNPQTFTSGYKTRSLTEEEKKFWKDEKTGLVPNLVEYDPKFGVGIQGYFGHFKKPVQPVIYQEEKKLQKPIPIYNRKSLVNFSTGSRPTPDAPPEFEVAQYDNTKPTKYSFSYPTGKYNEQKSVYFPDAGTWKQFIGSQKLINSDEGKGYGTATGYLKKGGLTANGARQILHDGTAQGHPLTDKQRRFFGAKSKGHTNFRGRK